MRSASNIVRRSVMVAMTVICAGSVSAQTPAPDPSGRAAANAARRAADGNLVGHGGPVKAIAVSPNGKHVLTGSFDYTAMLWDVSEEKPKQVHRLDDHNGAVNAVAFVGDDRALTAGDDGVVRLWDLATGKLLHRFTGHDAGSKIVSLSVSSDGAWAVSAGWDRTARLWDLRNRAAGPALRGHTGPVNAVVFESATSPAPQGHLFTASQDGQIKMWRVADGAELTVSYRHGFGIGAMLSDPHRTSSGTPLFIGTADGAVRIIDGDEGKVARDLTTYQRPVLSLAALAKPGLKATGGGDGAIRVLRADDGAILEEYKHPFGPVWALAFAPDGKGLYYAGLDDFVTLWRFAPRAPFEPVDSSQYPRRFQLNTKSDDPIAKGEIQFARKCSVCHTLTPDGANRAGPTLHNVFGRKIATLPGYPYSPELKTLDIVWNADTIGKLFELGPDKFTPGSKMPLQVMSDKTERDALIAFLEIATLTTPKPVDGNPPAAPQPAKP